MRCLTHYAPLPMISVRYAVANGTLQKCHLFYCQVNILEDCSSWAMLDKGMLAAMDHVPEPDFQAFPRRTRYRLSLLR